MDFTPSLKGKNFFRFTGPPENWLVAIKNMTWGLELKHQERWKDIQPGDIFFIHSTGPQTSAYSNAKSGVIGIGVVGSNFSIKENYLWPLEIDEHVNKWPLLVPFSEIYLFSDLPSLESWDYREYQSTFDLVSNLVSSSIPLSAIPGFPAMGSFSAVSDAVAEQILFDNRPLYSVGTTSKLLPSVANRGKDTQLQEIKSASESLRYAETLTAFDSVSTRIITTGTTLFNRNDEILSRAENAHSTVLQRLINIFRAQGYETFFNKYVDLYAYNDKKSYLIEVKSTENRNFRSQARKGIVQLYEYDYFEVNRYRQENKLSATEKHNLLVTSQRPSDEEYVAFINSLNIGVALAEEDTLVPVGFDSGFSKLT